MAKDTHRFLARGHGLRGLCPGDLCRSTAGGLRLDGAEWRAKRNMFFFFFWGGGVSVGLFRVCFI